MLEVPMYRVNGTRAQLADLLAKVPVNSWVWSVIEFDGAGQMPSNYSTLEFQKKIREQPHGLVLTWSEILTFSETIEYTIDCLIVAVSSIDKLEVDKLLADDFQECEVALRAIDSTEWILFSSSQTLLNKLEEAALQS
jgi:hypothetical protein